MNKKASLSLSINAIVILVLAITMLGLGLGFTKGMFSKFSSKLEVPPPNIPATPDEPIVLPDESIEILKNKDFELTVNFYNDYTSGSWTPSVKCAGLTVQTGTGKNVAGDYLSVPQTVPSGTYKPFKIIFTKLGKNGRGVCTIKFTEDKPSSGSTAQVVEKQITIISK